eukprot:TRINITY_DN8124_c0_g1_i2.p1 TRINITY_DN8124_c0_g1~~TRINITY_DN8124_c0_g1_i2.p1  ORF type:complete len:302 (-),score=60.21 TRINITY_DN8124_c0_g1_i2:208-1017(-)
MASKLATNRLRKDLKAILQDPPPHIHVSCDESNVLNWNYLLEGPEDTPYASGWYWGRLKFPTNYPLAPPSILMVTPSGRFETNTRLCLSMSDYHPETWNPSWSLGTVLKGLLSFMCEESLTAGAIDPPPSFEERRRLAASSVKWNKARTDFCKAFPQFDDIVAQARELRPAKFDEILDSDAAVATAPEATTEKFDEILDSDAAVATAPEATTEKATLAGNAGDASPPVVAAANDAVDDRPESSTVAGASSHAAEAAQIAKAEEELAKVL